MQAVRILWALPVAAAALMLSGCGGGGGAAPAPSATTPDRNASVKPIAVGEPNGKAIDSAPFVKEVQGADCADISNRLFVIDNTYVFWTRSGRCGDNSYEHVLYGATPDKKLCWQADSFAGPMGRCADESARPVFETIVKNLDKADLGLGSTHEIRKIDFAQTVAVAELHQTSYSNVETQKDMVIRSPELFNQVWEQVVGDKAPAPRIDFTRGIVLATFMGNRPMGCYGTRIASVVRESGKLVVQVQDSLPQPEMMCTQAITSPAHLVAIDFTDEPIEFRHGDQLRVIDSQQMSGVHESKNVVIRDQASWEALWKEHAPNQEIPKIDFDNFMVLGAFRGYAGGCDGVKISAAVEQDTKLVVTRTETYPGPAMACIAVVTSPAQLVQVKRTSKQVEFVTVRQELPAPDGKL